MSHAICGERLPLECRLGLEVLEYNCFLRPPAPNHIVFLTAALQVEIRNLVFEFTVCQTIASCTARRETQNRPRRPGNEALLVFKITLISNIFIFSIRQDLNPHQAQPVTHTKT